MRNLTLFSLVIALLSSSFSMAQTSEGNVVLRGSCQDIQGHVEKEQRRSKSRLQSRIEMEGIYKELAGDAKLSSQISTGLLATSATILGIVLFRSGKVVNEIPTMIKYFSKYVGGTENVVIVSAFGVGIGNAAGIGRSYYNYLEGKRVDHPEEIDVNTLLLNSKTFDNALLYLAKEREEVDLNYSQISDGLSFGLRDRATTAKLYSIAKAEREVEESRLQYFNRVAGLVQNCR